MFSKDKNVEECDATGAEHCGKVGAINKLRANSCKLQAGKETSNLSLEAISLKLAASL